MADTIVNEVWERILRDKEKYHCSRIVIAYSGGMDSSFLLHVVAAQSPSDTELIAVHINHHLQDDARCWEQHCHNQALRLGLQFTTLHIDVSAQHGVHKYSPEDAARRLRYQAFRDYLRAGDLLLTAHHADDQAETLLLQLLRGSGPEGLSAMPEVMPFGVAVFARPLLTLQRQQIYHFVLQHDIEWVEDNSNADIQYDRNYIRHRMAPILQERWPQWVASFNRASRHQAEAAFWMHKAGEILLRDCMQKDSTLNISACMQIEPIEQKLLIRQWLQHKALPVPSEKQLKYLLNTFLSPLSPPRGMVSWTGVQIRRYRNALYAMQPLQNLNKNLEKPWPKGQNLELAELNRTLVWSRLVEQLPESATAESLVVRLRRGGEKCTRFKSKMHQPLKKLFQELGVPPWLRDRIPLVYMDNQLRLLWDLKIC